MVQKSPIDLPSSTSTNKCEALCDLLFYYKNSQVSLTNSNGKEMILTYDSGSYIRFNEEIYSLRKISFPSRSFHKVQTKSYEMEIHLHHISTTTGKVLIISVLSESNQTKTISSDALDVLNNMPSAGDPTTNYNTPTTWSAYDFIPDGETNKSFYYYDGTLIRSPYTPGIKWIVFENPINCSKNFIDRLKKTINSIKTGYYLL